MKNFPLADSRELMAVTLILASWAQEQVWFQVSTHVLRRVHVKIFFSQISSVLMAIRLISGILSPKTSDSYVVDMMYVEFMKNFLLADWMRCS